MNFTTGTLQEPHWLAALILPSTEEPSFVLKDLGPVQRTLDLWKQWQDERPQHTTQAESDALYDTPLSPIFLIPDACPDRVHCSR